MTKHGRHRLYGPYGDNLSLMDSSSACLANALGLLREQRTARLELAASARVPTLEHHETNSAEVVLICPVLVVNTAGDWFRAVVEQVVMQLPITRAELLLFKEQCVIHERQGIEDVELCPLGQDQRVVNKFIQTFFRGGFVEGRGKANLGTVVEEVSDSDHLVSWIVDNGGLEVVEGEEVCDLMVLVLRRESAKM